MTFLRICLPRVEGRGAGLGNELIPWARAFIAAHVLGARCLPPAFGLNPRGYRRHFRTPRHDWISHRALQAAMPRVEFTEDDYLEFGGGDVLMALRRYAQARGLLGRQPLLLTTHGMWGGVKHVEAARDFVTTKLYSSRYAAGHLLDIRARLDPALPVVGVHVRLGDFAKPLAPDAYRSRFNASLPVDWYRHVMQSIDRQMAGQVQFLLLSDAAPETLAGLAPGMRCVVSGDLPYSDCSDLLALARCDLAVCSISTFSVWAAFLSDAPYLWYEPNLHQHPDGWLSIWGHESAQEGELGGTRLSLQALKSGQGIAGRAWAVGAEGEVPAGAITQAMARVRMRASDLVRYGAVRRAESGAALPGQASPQPVSRISGLQA